MFLGALEDTNSYLVINEDTENKKFIGRVVYQEDPVLEVIDEIPCSTDGTIVISVSFNITHKHKSSKFSIVLTIKTKNKRLNTKK